MWYQENNSEDGSKYDFTKTLMNSGNTERHYVLYQPDVCLPTWSPSGDGNSLRTDGNAVRYKGNLIDNINYKDTSMPNGMASLYVTVTSSTILVPTVTEEQVCVYSEE